jgi:hypothetical protein
VKNLEERADSYQTEKLYQQFGVICGIRLFVPHKRKRRSSVVMNTRSISQTNRQPKAPLEPVIQNDPLPPLPNGDQDHKAVLEA